MGSIDYNDVNLLKLQKGILLNNFFVYSKDDNLFFVKDDIRMFKVSFKRIKKTTGVSLDIILSIIINDTKNIQIIQEIENCNKYYLVIQYPNPNYKMIFKYNIKLKEINDYLKISEGEELYHIILKQNEKINILLNKIEYYEKKFFEPLTDDEFI